MGRQVRGADSDGRVNQVKFVPLMVKGCYVIELEQLSDDRGFFARIFCRREFSDHGLNPDLVQASISYNQRRGTLRGMHYQKPPFQEDKLVRCTRGCIHDVVLDLRPDSDSYRKWTAVELSAENRKAVYVPKGCAHGFQTLTDDSEVLYMMSEVFSPEHAAGVLWNDPAFEINWPVASIIISDRDRVYPHWVL